MQGLLKFVVFVVLFVGGMSPAAGQLRSLQVFPKARFRFEVVYHPGGLSAQEVMSEKRALIAAVFTGGYFNPKTLLNVDFTKVKVKPDATTGVKVAYLVKKHRPVLVFGRHGGARIVQPTRDGKILLYPEEWFALAGDYQAIGPKQVNLRHIIAITPTSLVSILYDGTDDMCRSFMRKRGLRNFMFLDGGSTPLMRCKVPSWVVVYKT